MWLQLREKPFNNLMREINGGFFVKQKIMNYIRDDQTIFERKPLQKQ